MRFYKLAADQGHSGAQYRLGCSYYSGKGVSEDCAEAVRYWKLAADQGNKVAQTALERISC